jgi:hypothetical protein
MPPITLIVAGKPVVYWLELNPNTNPQGHQLDLLGPDTTYLATIATVHASSGGDKIAGGYPGLNPDIFTVDGTGHLVNG